MTTSLTPPLDGIRVVDFATGIAGPHASLLLAHHGADVIKIEPPQGDWSRRLGVTAANARSRSTSSTPKAGAWRSNSRAAPTS
jgi:crotonobetainyl-CoA:carnitine CoA-transferase CaiB-like acyl-CoA transferase